MKESVEIRIVLLNLTTTRLRRLCSQTKQNKKIKKKNINEIKEENYDRLVSIGRTEGVSRVDRGGSSVMGVYLKRNSWRKLPDSVKVGSKEIQDVARGGLIRLYDIQTGSMRRMELERIFLSSTSTRRHCDANYH